jgi:lipopolysaccharide/colanic/teichoic acid biosynthesis glycosyltransferase
MTAKRIFDLAIAIPALVLLSPLFALLALGILLDAPGPVFYRGRRVGLGGRQFHIFKFRTMAADAETNGPSSTADDDPRITTVGRLLRRYKADELPQLINVVLGDMSLVGPRPQVPWAVDLYSENERELLQVPPGITDFASLRYRSEGAILRGSPDPDGDYLRLIAPGKIALGLEYVRRRSVWLDLRIVLATLGVAFGIHPSWCFPPELRDAWGPEPRHRQRAAQRIRS